MKRRKTTHVMTGLLMIGFIFLFMILAGRFFYIQVTGEVNNVSLEEWAKEKRATHHTLEAERGKIFDQNGVTLAYDRRSYRMYAILDESFTLDENSPNHVVDFDDTAQKLAEVLNVEASYIKERLTRGKEEGAVQIEFGHAGKDLSIEMKKKIEDLNLPGIQFFEESLRHYPNGVFASHILGFARKEENDEASNDITGVIGIEKELDDLLRGQSGHISYQRDYYQNKLLNPDEILQKPIHGHDVYLTIDQKIQVLLEDVITEVEAQYEPERITATLMDAKTGEILAMSNRPSFDPNEPKDVQNWYNDIISTPFEPGSTMKIFTWAAAIDAGVYKGDELYTSGRYQINPMVDPVHDHNNGEGWGKISYDEGFIRSSNVAASKLVWDYLGTDQYLEYLEAFHFDEKTNIDLPGEVTGKIVYNWPRDKLSTSFGQGTTLTPIQQLKAVTAITNKGEMLQPYVVDKIVDPETKKVVKEKKRTVVDQPISETTAEEVLKLLEKVVHSDYGTGKIYQLDSYSVGGKTGTAQIPDPEGGYITGRENNIFSFLGMAPLDEPRLIMYVSVAQPSLEDHEPGALPVSYIFKSVMENSLHYLNITPDKKPMDPVETVTIPALDQKVSAVQKNLVEKGLKVTVVGDGQNVLRANVEEGEKVFQHQHIILITDKPKMPNVEGWSLREVQQLAHLLNLKLETIGHGYVVQQYIKEGTPLKENSYLGVELKQPSE